MVKFKFHVKVQTNYVTYATIVDCIRCHMLFTVRDNGYSTWKNALPWNESIVVVHGIQLTTDWRKLYDVCQTRTIASGLLRYPGVLVTIGRTSLKKKINCINIKSEVIIIYGTYEPILSPLMHIFQKLWYTWNKRICICHIQISCHSTN